MITMMYPEPAGRSADFQICCIAGFPTCGCTGIQRPSAFAPCRLGSRRYSRLGSLRYVSAAGAVEWLPNHKAGRQDSDGNRPRTTMRVQGIDKGCTRVVQGISKGTTPSQYLRNTGAPRWQHPCCTLTMPFSFRQSAPPPILRHRALHQPWASLDFHYGGLV